MGIVALQMRVMPESLDVNLEEIKTKVEKVLTEEGAKNVSFEEQPIAFGLKALLVKAAWPEEKDTDLAENKVKEIEGISSVEITGYTRAFG